MRKKFSPAFMSALIGMSIITHAHAEPTKITEEEIDRLYLDEIKIPGATVKCYQAGKEIINEPGLKDLSVNEDGVSGWRLDGSRFSLKTFKSGNDVSCTIINRKKPE